MIGSYVPEGLVTGRNEVVANVMFLLVSVILLTGGVCRSACWEGSTPPQEGSPPRKEAPPPGKKVSPWEGSTPSRYGQ